MLNERKDLEVEFNELPEETDETPKKTNSEKVSLYKLFSVVFRNNYL